MRTSRACLGLLLLVGCSSNRDTIATTAPPRTTVSATTTTAEPAYQPTFTSDDCPVDIPIGRDVECGYLEVPEKRSDPTGTTIRLAVAIFKSEAASPAPDPIVYLDGGPGGHSLETIPYSFERAFSPFLDKRDFIMFDQRGVGFSRPGLYCPEYLDELNDIADEDVASDESAQREIASLLECRSRLLEENEVDLTAYNTAESSADVADLRSALGYADWNLYGISYGTRLGLGVMRDYPEGVRSVILDSTLPLEADLMTEGPSNFSRALQVLFNGCETDPSCSAAYPDLEQRLQKQVAELEQAPRTIDVTNPITSATLPTVVDGGVLLGVVFQSLYSAQAIVLLPAIVADLEQGETAKLAQLLGNLQAQLSFWSGGMGISVTCHEEIPFSSEAEVKAAVAADPLLAEFEESSINTGQHAFELCQAWEAGVAATVENQPIRSSIPTLVLSGEYDPITPPAWGRMVAANLSNSFFFEFPGVGHAASVEDECPLDVALSFLDDPARSPDASCISEMDGPDFAVPGRAQPVSLHTVTVEIEGGAAVELKVPEGWKQQFPGTFARRATVIDETALVVIALPVLTGEQLLGLMDTQLSSQGLELTEAGTFSTVSREWKLRSGSMQGSLVDIATSDADGVGLLILLAANVEEHSSLMSAVFEPAMESIQLA